MRAAVLDGAGGWSNSYPDALKLGEVDAVRPVVMYLTCRRRRWGGQYRYVFVPFDLDASRGGRDQVQADARALAGLLAAHGIACVPVRSGPSGGIHLWTACPAGLAPELARTLGELAERLYPSVDPAPLTNPGSGALRPPGAAHRSGHGHAELDGIEATAAVAILRKGSRPAAFERLARTLENLTGAPALLGARAATAVSRARHAGQQVPPSIARRGPAVRDIVTDEDGHVRLRLPWRPLGSRALAALRRRPEETPGAHQAAVHSVLVRCALAGWTYQQARTLVEDAAASPALEWLRSSGTADGRYTLHESETERRLTRRWWLAVQEAARLPQRHRAGPRDGEELSEGAAAAADLLARIEAAGPAPWHRPSGPADLAVLRSVAYLMAISGTADISANVRRLAVLSGRSKSTAALSLNRLEADGWTTTTEQAIPGACRARRIAPATGHTCPDDPHHICAVHDKAPGQRDPAGSDRSDNARPQRGQGDLISYLQTMIVRQQSGVWHALGHHAGRTLEAIESGVRTRHLTRATGYAPETITRHLEALTAVGLLDPCSAQRTGCPLYEAAAQLGQAGRPAELAVSARVDEECHRWWLAEQEWCAAPRGAKPRQADRPDARQTVLPGMDPYERRYPRHPHHSTRRTGAGRADHRTAWEIEAQRIGAADLLAEACEIERRGDVVDPAQLGRSADHQTGRAGDAAAA
ncbi:hypothetical protein [Streptomyces pseudovenezuelae]|uniref:hypothetical protein n=1 Tax=Streptomyces pseudovenezuelae TaxID=67350 RepID=UPI0036E234F3